MPIVVATPDAPKSKKYKSGGEASHSGSQMNIFQLKDFLQSINPATGAGPSDEQGTGKFGSTFQTVPEHHFLSP